MKSTIRKDFRQIQIAVNEINQDKEFEWIIQNYLYGYADAIYRLRRAALSITVVDYELEILQKESEEYLLRFKLEYYADFLDNEEDSFENRKYFFMRISENEIKKDLRKSIEDTILHQIRQTSY